MTALPSVSVSASASAWLLAGTDTGKAGPLALLVVVLLGVACYFLFKSMSRHLRKVQNGFPPAAPTRPAGDGNPQPDIHRADSETDDHRSSPEGR